MNMIAFPDEAIISPVQLVLNMEKHNRRYLPIFVRTAAAHGWFTDGVMVLKLTKEEQKEFQKIAADRYSSKETVLKNNFLDGASKGKALQFETMVEGSKDKFPYYPPLIKMATKEGQEVVLHGYHFLMVSRRHPSCKFYTTSWLNFDEKPVLAIAKDKKVALLMPYNITRKLGTHENLL